MDLEYLHGNWDSPLTPVGFEQARLLGERLGAEGVRFDRVYSSSMLRAVQTTETMLGAMGEGGREFERVDEIVEQRSAGWRGRRLSEVMTPDVVAYMRSKGAQFVPPDGESFSMVQRRFANWVEDEFLHNAEVVGNGGSLRVAIVAHGIANKCFMRYVLGFDEQYVWKMLLENTSVSRFRFNHLGWVPVSINDAGHLRGPA